MALPLLLHPLHGALLDEVRASALDTSPSVVLGCGALAALYAWAVGPLARRLGWSEVRPERWRSVCWYAGIAIFFASVSGPLHELAEVYLFSAHMGQHILIMMIVPPLLIVGLPPALIRRLLRHRAVLRTGRLLTHPGAAFVAYNLVFLGWHLPGAYNAALVNHDLHILQHLMFISTAVMMWWPVVAPVAELERIPDGPVLMMYVFAFGVPTTILSAFITMSERVFYPFYAAAPRITELTALQDQRLGGLLMWIPGMLIFWIAISAIWFRWTREEYAEWRQEARQAAAAHS
jgi:putative membrane protein